MKRLTDDQLMKLMIVSQDMVPAGYVIRHVRTGAEYMVRGHALRVGDLGLLVNYSPLTGPVVIFCRTAADIRAKFVRSDGKAWTAPNPAQADQ